MAVFLLRGYFVRVQVLKRPIVTTDAENTDGFCVGAIKELSAKVAILMTAARWVRRVLERRCARRSELSPFGRFPDRRLLPDRRAMGAA